MVNLFAICRNIDGLEVKRVVLDQTVQTKIEGVFTGQASAFLDGITDEVPFGSDWRPDADEILVMDTPPEAQFILDEITGDITALNTLDAKNFIGENIKALVVATGPEGSKRLLMQLFSAQQILSRRFLLMLEKDTFVELTEPTFTLDNYLVAIVENGKLKFKSYHLVRRIFALSHLYQEATQQQIEEFCAHESLHVADIARIKELADEPIRKLVHAVHKSNVMTQYGVDDISKASTSVGLNIDLVGGKILFPDNKKDIKILLRFLDDGIYVAPLTSKLWMTNSKRAYS
ncbi:Kiwa anti-phage protein KwaB-like domain-containing protein [Methylorubrum extorquens]|uniref:Kiwa anti-phage protein KwaB-like domain-containing protein n=1 Tax=Methylorubrum extorquens TaxID=408 RepID=UPI003F616998